jgi:hypothetical protein
MIDLLRNLYSRLPIVRELCNLTAVRDSLLVIAEELRRIRADQAKIVQQQMADFEERLLASARYSDPRNLARFEQHVYSQFGEDGMIAEIFRRIGSGSKTFVEVGIGTGIENNTVFLLQQGWRGGWIEANPRSVDLVRRRFHRCEEHFEPPFTSKKHYEPFRQFLERGRGHRLCFDDRFDSV